MSVLKVQKISSLITCLEITAIFLLRFLIIFRRDMRMEIYIQAEDQNRQISVSEKKLMFG